MEAGPGPWASEKGACSDFQEEVLCESGLRRGDLARLVGEDGHSGPRQSRSKTAKRIFFGPGPKICLLVRISHLTLEPGEEVQFAATDRRSTPLPPGLCPGPLGSQEG